jgi:hypothetical protein
MQFPNHTTLQIECRSERRQRVWIARQVADSIEANQSRKPASAAREIREI